MTDELDRILGQLKKELKHLFGQPSSGPVIERVDHELYHDSSGDPALRFMVVLQDPPDQGVYPFVQLKPIRDFVDDYLRREQVEYPAYTRFILMSEEREIRAGTYYE